MTKKLLIVDENTTIQRVVKLAFREEAIQVITVPRGRDAFEQIERELPDIVLADNGREISGFMKARPHLSRIPVVLLQGAFESAPGGDAGGCDAVLMKPLQPKVLIESVKSLLLKHAAAPAARVTPAERVAPPINTPAVERFPAPDVELDRYFHGLALAFSIADDGPAPAPAGTSWTGPIPPPDVVAAHPAPPSRP